MKKLQILFEVAMATQKTTASFMQSCLSAKFSLAIMIFCLAFVTQVESNAQEGQTKIMFCAEDAVGNRDTVCFIVHPDATYGVDTSLGEVNIYGQPSESDLDLRIIRRSDTLWWFPTPNHLPEGKEPDPYWLHNPSGGINYGIPYSVGYSVYVRSAPDNFDFKTEYVPTSFFDFTNGIAIKLVNAKHYPIEIKFEVMDTMTYQIFNTGFMCAAFYDNYEVIEDLMDYINKLSGFDLDNKILTKINIEDSLQNYIMVFDWGIFIGINEKK